MIVWPTPEQHPQLVAWIAQHIDRGVIDPTTVSSLGVVNAGGKLLAGAYYGNYIPFVNVEISFAATDPRWATRGHINAILGYPFYQLSVRRITAITHIRNRRVAKLLKGLGFMREGKLHQWFDDGHAIVFGMTREYFLRSKWHGHDGSRRTGSGSRRGRDE